MPRTRGVPLPAAVHTGSKRKGRITTEAAVAFCSVVQYKGERVQEFFGVYSSGRGPSARELLSFHASPRTHATIQEFAAEQLAAAILLTNKRGPEA